MFIIWIYVGFKNLFYSIFKVFVKGECGKEDVKFEKKCFCYFIEKGQKKVQLIFKYEINICGKVFFVDKKIFLYKLGVMNVIKKIR